MFASARVLVPAAAICRNPTADSQCRTCTHLFVVPERLLTTRDNPSSKRQNAKLSLKSKDVEIVVPKP
jgi:hypothetical protein